IASAAAAAGYAGIAILKSPSEFAPFLLLTSYAMATASTLCGALLAENGRTFQQSGLFVNQQWLWFYAAIMASAFVGRALVGHLSPWGALKAAASIAAVAPIAVLIATPLLLKEARSGVTRQQFRDTSHGIVAALRSRRLWLVALFLFLYSFAPGFGTPL